MKSKFFKRLVLGLVFIGLLLIPSMSFGAATCVVSEDNFGSFRVITLSWLAHTDGAVASGTCDETTSAILGNVSGVLVGVKFEPSAGNPPTAAYDVVLNTAGGADVLFGSGANQTDDDSVTTMWQSPLNADSKSPTLYQENLDLVVGAAGSGNEGKVILVIMRY